MLARNEQQLNENELLSESRFRFKSRPQFRNPYAVVKHSTFLTFSPVKTFFFQIFGPTNFFHRA